MVPTSGAVGAMAPDIGRSGADIRRDRRNLFDRGRRRFGGLEARFGQLDVGDGPFRRVPGDGGIIADGG